MCVCISIRNVTLFKSIIVSSFFIIVFIQVFTSSNHCMFPINHVRLFKYIYLADRISFAYRKFIELIAPIV